jgi:hypothetical protein
VLSLADAILQEDMRSVEHCLRYGSDINQLDEYGYTPLIEAAIIDNVHMTEYLLKHGANPNQQDVTGGTALQWAAENNNVALCQLLLDHHANVNAYNFSGQPVLVMPTLRHHSALRQLLVKAGADPVFCQDYINTKLLGHLYELVGTASIVDLNNHFVEVDLEGFYLEVTIGLLSESLAQFQNHFAARQLRRYAGLAQFIVTIMRNASQLIAYQQYRVNIHEHLTHINELIQHKPLMIPVGYEGHAISFIAYGDIWCKCDRREDSRLFDNIMFYRVTNKQQLTAELIKKLLYEKLSSQFVNEELDKILGLQPMTELKIEAQISGNCSWANVEATIPALFFLVSKEMNKKHESEAYYKTLAMNFFHRFREWNKDRALHYCIQRYKEGDFIRKACHAELLIAILFQRCDIQNSLDRDRIDTIISTLVPSPYEYIFKNYLRMYYYENHTEEGKRFAALLRHYEFLI